MIDPVKLKHDIMSYIAYNKLNRKIIHELEILESNSVKYGHVMKGYFIATETGNYKFRI